MKAWPVPPALGVAGAAQLQAHVPALNRATSSHSLHHVTSELGLLREEHHVAGELYLLREEQAVLRQEANQRRTARFGRKDIGKMVSLGLHESDQLFSMGISRPHFLSLWTYLLNE